MNALPQFDITLATIVDDLPEELKAVPVSGLAIDSRKVRPGDVFLACAGHEVDGRDFIGDAVSRGAQAVIADAPIDAGKWPLPVIPCSALSTRVSEIAGRFYGHPSRDLNLLGVTGTNGKSTVVMLLAQLIEMMNQPCGVIGTLGSGRIERLESTVNTTPDAVQVQALLQQWLSAGAQWAAMEVSSHGLVQQRVAALHFAAAVFTNLSPEHLDYHQTMDAYGEAKASLFKWDDLPLAVINVDDQFGLRLAGRVAKENPECKLLRYSASGAEAEFWLSDIKLSHSGAKAKLHCPEGEFTLSSSLLGVFNLSNVLAVLACLYGSGFAIKKLLPMVKKLRPVPGRMQCLNSTDGVTAVVDYAHTPDALEQVLESLRAHTQGKLHCVFGCGGDRDRKKRPLMGAIAARLADTAIITNDNPRSEAPDAIARDIQAGVGAESLPVQLDREQAIREAIANAEAGDIVLIAGKGHENYQQFSEQRLAFSDEKIARLALAERGEQ